MLVSFDIQFEFAGFNFVWLLPWIVTDEGSSK